jgi:hypothetical protein
VSFPSVRTNSPNESTLTLRNNFSIAEKSIERLILSVQQLTVRLVFCHHEITIWRESESIMKMWVGSILVLLQVLVCTLGQGALTLCVHNDGTQQLEWTSSNEEGCCHCGCESACTDEKPVQAPGFPGFERTCNSCTDYLLVVDQPSVTVEKSLTQTFENASAIALVIQQPLSLINFTLHSPLFFGKQSHLTDSFATIASTVVIRC